MPDQSHSPGVQPHVDPSTSGLAMESLAYGLLGFFTAGFTGIIAVILGHIALSRIKRSGGAQAGRGLAIGGLVTGYLGCLVVLTLGFAMHTLKVNAATARMRQIDSDFRTFDLLLKEYKRITGAYPTTGQGLGVLVEKPTLAPEPERWVQVMKNLPVDTWNASYDYRFPGRRNPEKPEIICKGQDGTFGTADDVSSQEP